MSVIHIDHIRRCDFCGMTENEVVFLIESPDFKTHICNECVDACRRAIEEATVDVRVKDR